MMHQRDLNERRLEHPAALDLGTAGALEGIWHNLRFRRSPFATSFSSYWYLTVMIMLG